MARTTQPLSHGDGSRWWIVGILDVPEDLVEEVDFVVVRPHAVAQEHQHHGFVADGCDEPAEGAVERGVDVLEWIADALDQIGVVVGMGGVVEVPEQMAAAGLTEDRHEQVPLGVGEEVLGDPRPPLDAAEQVTAEIGVFPRTT